VSRGHDFVNVSGSATGRGIWIRTHNLSRQAVADLRLRPSGHWDWLCYVEATKITWL